MSMIQLKGNYKNEADLVGDKVLPAGAVPFKEGDTVQEIFVKGFFVGLPLIIAMIVLTVTRCGQIDYTFAMDTKMMTTIFVTSLVLILLPYLHEWIHAMLYPKDALKTIWKYPEQGAYFVYCDAIITKTRFIVLSLAPAVILGVVPFIVWLCVAERFPMPYGLGFVFTTWIMTVMSVGDFANVYNAIRQVPVNAKVFNYGIHSYWIQKEGTSDEA